MDSDLCCPIYLSRLHHLLISLAYFMKQKIFLIIGILLLSFFGVSIYNEFMANHTYYQSMLAGRANRKLFL